MFNFSCRCLLPDFPVCLVMWVCCGSGLNLRAYFPLRGGLPARGSLLRHPCLLNAIAVVCCFVDLVVKVVK